MDTGVDLVLHNLQANEVIFPAILILLYFSMNVLKEIITLILKFRNFWDTNSIRKNTACLCLTKNNVCFCLKRFSHKEGVGKICIIGKAIGGKICIALS